MIRINLAKASATVTVEPQSVAKAGLAAFSPSDNIAKVVAMLIFALCLYGYEKYNIAGKVERLRIVEAEAAEIAAQVVRFGPVTSVVEDLAKERKKLSKQMEVIQKISKKRAFKLQSIVTMQKSIDTDTWVEEMDVGDEIILFKGFSRNPTSIQSIVSALEKLEFIEGATNKELTMKKIGNNEVHQFNIEARIEQ